MSRRAAVLSTSTMEPGIGPVHTTLRGGHNTSTHGQTFNLSFLLALTDNSTDNDNSSVLGLLTYVLSNKRDNSSDDSAVPDQTTTPGQNMSTTPVTVMTSAVPATVSLPSAVSAPVSLTSAVSAPVFVPSADPALVSVPGPTTANSSTNMYDIQNLTDVTAVLHTTNVSGMSVSSLNIITSHIQTFLHSEPIDARNVTHILSYLSEATQTNANTVEMVTSIVTEVIQDETSVQQGDIFGSMMPDLMLTMENVLSASHPSDIVSFSTPEIEVSSAVIQTNGSMDGYVVVETIIGRVTMPVILVEDGRIRMTTIVYQNIQKRWTVQSYSHAEIGSDVMSVSLQRLNNVTSERLNISQPKSITMVLPTKVNGREKERLCTFWNFHKRIWDTSGGRLLTKNDSYTECQFDHLTNFAVLVLYYDQPLDLSTLQRQSLFILTVVGCSLSITCLGVSIILYIYLRLLCDEKILIHANLSAALMLAQLVLVTSHGAEKVSAACKTVAVLLHYLFMASFSWMMLEGLAVYLACTRGLYNYGDMRFKYFLIGWGLPAIIVVVSVGVQFPNYGETTDDSCWLSVKDGLIWAFLGPMLVVVVFNLLILCLVIKVFLTLRANSRKTQAAKLRASVRAMATLLPLLGVTWVLSILVPLHYVFHYLFIIGNSMQGIMIFLLHGIGNEEVRKGLSERRKRHSMTLSESLTTIDSSQPKILRFKQLLVPAETLEKGNGCPSAETLEKDRRQAWTGL